MLTKVCQIDGLLQLADDEVPQFRQLVRHVGAKVSADGGQRKGGAAPLDTELLVRLERVA